MEAMSKGLADTPQTSPGPSLRGSPEASVSLLQLLGYLSVWMGEFPMPSSAAQWEMGVLSVSLGPMPMPKPGTHMGHFLKCPQRAQIRHS